MSTATSGPPALVLRAETSSNGRDFLPRRHQSRSSEGSFGVSKPSMIVRTESNVLKMERRMPISPCVVCNGTGRVDCHECRGRGRTNFTHLPMLPNGEWPKWCKTCGGSGLGYCGRCLGTGEYRDIMGFHFMKPLPNPPSVQHH